ncbi:hypothetical protein M501DRAFT_1017548 [Patellaria atrata CBS 101060]|uniref:Uncharacterized protein n=1 Tax=Patellaria atrata CBS 101060 TaxID=1346257 RepID=A0A9P4S7Z9_9PEZI|nr:hypothetical protein M501DRAFT_1017548 [Patellaria atrata CBS 101060]
MASQGQTKYIRISNTPDLELTTRRIDLAARGIDLLTAFTELTTSSSPVTRAAIEVGQWLGREKLNRNQLQFCLEKARGLVIPNANGNKFYDLVWTGISSHTVLPLLTQPSGALGRLLVNDPHLCWMTSTIAGLFQYHSERYVSDTVTAMILQANALDGTKLSEYQLAWHPVRIQLKPVVDKIVSSVWFNIVNSGNSNIKLPEEITTICPRGHYLESDSLGQIIESLRSAKPRVIVQSVLLLNDVILWLILHFNGHLRVVVSGNIVYDQALGPEQREIEVRIKKPCDGEIPCQDEKEKLRYEIMEDIAGQYNEFLTGEYSSRQEPEPRVRQQLYCLQKGQTMVGVDKKTEMNILTRCTAQEIVKWILALPINRVQSSNEISFRVDLEGQTSTHGSDETVATLLKNTPSMVNMHWGSTLAGKVKVIFSEPALDLDMGTDINSDSDLMPYGVEDDVEVGPESILQYFPILKDLLHSVKADCRCLSCKRNPASSKNTPLKHGCLQYFAFTNVMALVAHGIADGFGADSVSSIISSSIDPYGTHKLLLHLVQYQEVNWQEWFKVAACVYLGCSEDAFEPPVDFKTRQSPTESFEDVQHFSSTLVAVQYGNLAVVAPWLDIAQPHDIQGSFAFVTANGKLSVVTNPSGSNPRSCGIQEEFAIIETQKTEEVTEYTSSYSRFMKHFSRRGEEVSIETDDSTLTSDVILVPSGGYHYKLLLRVLCPSHSRFIDPTKAMLKKCETIPVTTCNHLEKKSDLIVPSLVNLALYSFDEIVGIWPQDYPMQADHIKFIEAERRAGSTKLAKQPIPVFNSKKSALQRFVHVTNILDTHTKYNVALALAEDGEVLVNHGGACMQCAVQQALDCEQPLNGVETVNQARWLINTTGRLKHAELIEFRKPSNKRKLKE